MDMRNAVETTLAINMIVISASICIAVVSLLIFGLIKLWG